MQSSKSSKLPVLEAILDELPVAVAGPALRMLGPKEILYDLGRTIPSVDQVVCLPRSRTNLKASGPLITYP